MGRVTPEHLHSILWAANTYARSADPAAEINNYLIANRQWTANVREDSGQPEGWRDYQQVVSELGLIYSVKLTPQITLTPLGLAFLDGSIGFSELMTLQALRFQYPNGHHLVMAPWQREELAGTRFASLSTLTMLQHNTGVSIRPGPIAWRILRRLLDEGSEASISVDEFETYLMRCTTNGDWELCADAMLRARTAGVFLPLQGQRKRRNAQDWIRFLSLTSIFSLQEDQSLVLKFSEFGMRHAMEIDEMCAALEAPGTFWQPGNLSSII